MMTDGIFESGKVFPDMKVTYPLTNLKGHKFLLIFVNICNSDTSFYRTEDITML